MIPQIGVRIEFLSKWNLAFKEEMTDFEKRRF
ncbi:hypothetical protein PUN28_008782 [Cardiocondyla obscurior]|uniref:Uncharacterized protein n=1 Tax=Cardiocondyla obscurior TaxID=286306 RepID=A0AAW2FUQ2_9HYME